MKLSEKIKAHLSERIENGDLNNDEIVELIEHLGMYLNLKTIPDYAKENNRSYNGVKNHRTIRIIFNVKFVIDNQ